MGFGKEDATYEDQRWGREDTSHPGDCGEDIPHGLAIHLPDLHKTPFECILVATGERSFAWSGQSPGCRKHHRFARFSALTASPHIAHEFQGEGERSRGRPVLGLQREQFPWSGS